MSFRHGCIWLLQAPKDAARNIDIWTKIWIFVQWMSSPHIPTDFFQSRNTDSSSLALVAFQVWIVACVLLVQEIWKHHWGFAHQCSNTNFHGFEAVLPLQDFAVGLGWLATFSKHMRSYCSFTKGDIDGLLYQCWYFSVILLRIRTTIALCIHTTVDIGINARMRITV